MSSLGQKLRRARQEQGKTLEDIAAVTRINPRHLAAIEEDRLDLLPGKFFARSFVRQYAQLLGLPEQEWEPLLRQALEPLPQPLLPGQDGTGTRSPRPAARRLRQTPPAGFARRAAVLASILAGTAGLGYWYWSSHKAGSQPVNQVEASSTISRATPPAALDQAPPAPALTPAGPTGEPQSIPQKLPVTTGQEKLELRIQAQAETWLRISTPEEILFTGLLLPGETRTFSAREEMTMVVGNAGGVSLTLNGQPLPALGAPGQVRRVRISAEGLEFLPQQEQNSSSLRIPRNP